MDNNINMNNGSAKLLKQSDNYNDITVKEGRDLEVISIYLYLTYIAEQTKMVFNKSRLSASYQIKLLPE